MLKTSLASAFIFLQTVCFAQGPAQQLSQSFNTLLADPQTKYAMTSICVLDANSGRQIIAKNENIGMATASTLKTITAATALSMLGKDFHYQTTLGYSGTISPDGTLKGDLIITGGGDPTLASWRYENKEGIVLNQWVTAVKAAGIRKIEGRIIGDDHLWGTQGTPEGWTWQDMGNYFGAGPSALTWRENQFDIKLRAGHPVSVTRTVPAMPYLTIVNELKPGEAGSGDRAYAFLPPLSTIAYLRGSWATDIQKPGISVALPDPAFDAAFRLQDTLQRAGITISTTMPSTARSIAAARLSVPLSTKTLSTITSPPLSEIIYWLNKKSVNLYAEHLLKTIALQSGREATTSNGAAAEIRYWAEKGIDKNALNIIDGSGLSPATRVTAAAMASILFQSQKEEWFPEFYKSLPENNGMKLKSGTINDVSAFAGYYTAQNNNKYVIVIMINNYSGGRINPKLFRVLDALK